MGQTIQDKVELMFEGCVCVCVCPAQGIWSGLLGVLQEEGGGRPAPGPARAPPRRHITVCVPS